MSSLVFQAPAAVALTTSATGGTLQSFVGGNCVLNVPGSNRLNGQRFSIKASGLIQFNAGTYTSAITAILYAASSIGATVTSSAAVFTATGAGVVSSATASAQPISLVVDFEGDNTSAKIQGVGSGLVNNVVQASAAIGNAPTSVNFATEPPLQCAVAITAASQVAAVVLSQFQLEA